MSLKNKAQALAKCNAICRNTLMETLDIKFIDIGDDFLTASMPVTSKVHQPDGVLHGGASVALAESVGSAASMFFLDESNFFIRGIEISANHVKSISEGMVYARATFLHKGRTTQLWEIRITNEEDKLISIVKLTTIALPKKAV
ncbi:PaaI family thioesterase [Leeuwenhoekiella aequorea]|nr:hotdog fold thioesterase [Leeuwenhoekiella aequorea]